MLLLQFVPEIEANDIVVLGDALQGQVFARTYRRTQNDLQPQTDLAILSAVEVYAHLKPGTWVTGTLPTLAIPTGVEIVPSDLRLATPAALLAVAQACPWACTRDFWSAEPLYLRGSSAEEKLRKGT